MTQETINIFEKLNAQLQSLHEEISAITKKSQNDALNKFKLKFVNQAIAEANNLLGNEYKPFWDFEKFDDIELPTNSDVTMILGQYLSCMEKLRSDNIIQSGAYWYWVIEGETSKLKTAPPQKLGSK